MEWVSQVLNNFVQTEIKSSVPPNKNKVGNIVWFLKKYLYMSKTSVKKHYNYIPFSGKIFLSHMSHSLWQKKYIAINLRGISNDPIFQNEKPLCIATVSPASDATPHSPPAALGIAAPVRVTPPVPPWPRRAPPVWRPPGTQIAVKWVRHVLAMQKKWCYLVLVGKRLFNPSSTNKNDTLPLVSLQWGKEKSWGYSSKLSQLLLRIPSNWETNSNLKTHHCFVSLSLWRCEPLRW